MKFLELSYSNKFRNTKLIGNQFKILLTKTYKLLFNNFVTAPTLKIIN